MALLKYVFYAVVVLARSCTSLHVLSVERRQRSATLPAKDSQPRLLMDDSFSPFSRRRCLQFVLASVAVVPGAALAASDDAGYDNPNIPPGPVERSGLVVLRVAEVANYQEKLIRAILNKDIDLEISPQQIVFGTQILLRNSNIAGNMKLMIDTEIPKERKAKAAKAAAKAMNTIQGISSSAAKIERPFTEIELLAIADLYLDLRLQLNSLYEYLTPKGKEKYYGYFMKVTEYEKKIAEGTYNPELDGILQLDD